MSQFQAFCASAVKAKAFEHAAMLNQIALGAQGTEKSIKEAVKQILKSADGNS